MTLKTETRIASKVRGTTFRFVSFDATKPGDRLELYREYDNPQDPNAVRVVQNGSFIGYIGRDLAVQLAEVMDAGDDAYAVVTEVTGGTVDAPNRGINIVVVITQEIDDSAFIGAGR